MLFVNSGCSNHMTGTKSIFEEFHVGEKMKVEVGTGKELQVEGKCTVGIEN